MRRLPDLHAPQRSGRGLALPLQRFGHYEVGVRRKALCLAPHRDGTGLARCQAGDGLISTQGGHYGIDGFEDFKAHGQLTYFKFLEIASAK